MRFLGCGAEAYNQDLVAETLRVVPPNFALLLEISLRRRTAMG
jgi:hypothetical protein